MKFPNTFLYSISWEDAEVDKPVLDVQPTDKVLTLTGGGDNVFNLVLDGAERVDCVDLNPCQYHLMELKLKTLLHGTFEQLWALFGEGKMDNFDIFLIRSIYTSLSIRTFSFWYTNMRYFKSPGLYYQGSMGHVVWVARMIGLKHMLCNPWIQNTTPLYRLFLKYIQFVIWLFCSVFGSTRIMWSMFGTPPNQIKLITQDMRLASYVTKALTTTFDRTNIMKDNYYYYLILNGKFTMTNCPEYLKQKNFKYLKDQCSDRIRNMNGSLIDVMKMDTYNKIILMDHMDWMDKAYVDHLCRVMQTQMKTTGRAIFRSASLVPWYVDVVKTHGFRVTNISNCRDTPYMDRVNMYASFWTIEHETQTDLTI